MSLPPQRVVVSSDQTQGWVQLCRKPQRQRDHGQSYGLSSNGGGVLHATWAPQPGGAGLV